jgi:hypothetical protein
MRVPPHLNSQDIHDSLGHIYDRNLGGPKRAVDRLAIQRESAEPTTARNDDLGRNMGAVDPAVHRPPGWLTCLTAHQ